MLVLWLRGGFDEESRRKAESFLDGHRIEGTAVLADGSLIVLGATALKFRIFDAASSTETVSRHTEN